MRIRRPIVSVQLADREAFGLERGRADRSPLSLRSLRPTIRTPPMSLDSSLSVEKPQNGLAGLAHWRYDLRSGFMVAMISLPFSMGIAITSGAPPVCGIISAIIAGFVLPFLGGSYVTISGPAAGLAPALFAGMITLGSARLRQRRRPGRIAARPATRWSWWRSASPACSDRPGPAQGGPAQRHLPGRRHRGDARRHRPDDHRQADPAFMGVKFEAHEFWEILGEMPGHFATMNLGVLWPGHRLRGRAVRPGALPGRLFKVMPPPVWVFIVRHARRRLVPAPG